MIGYVQTLEKLGFELRTELATDLILQLLPELYKQFVVNYEMHELDIPLPELLKMLQTVEDNLTKGKGNDVLLVQGGKGKKMFKKAKKNGPKGKGNTDPKSNSSKLKPKGGVAKDSISHHSSEVGHLERNCKQHLATKKKGEASALDPASMYVMSSLPAFTITAAQTGAAVPTIATATKPLARLFVSFALAVGELCIGSWPFLKINRNLEIGHKKFMLNCAKANIGPMKSYRLFKESVGGYNNVGATAIDFKNFKRDLKAYIAGADAQMLIDKLLRKKQTCSAFHFDYDVDESDQLTRVFWYKMVFTPFTGVDNHCRCVTFEAGLLRREDVPSYRWLFNRFLDAMGHAPQCIITDQDASMAISIPERMSQAAGDDGQAVPHGEPEHVSVHTEASSFTPQQVPEQAAPGAGPVPEAVPNIQPQFAVNFMNFLQQLADVPEPVQWATFEQLFHEEYIPEHFVEAKREEFLKFTQGELTLSEYRQKFDELAGFGQDLVPTMEKRCKRFVEGLRPDLSAHLITAPRVDINALFKHALDMNAALIKKAEYEQAQTTHPRPPPPSSSSKGSPSVPSRSHTSKKTKSTHAPSPVPTQESGKNPKKSGYRYSICTQCGRRHPGECWFIQGLCLGCGQAEHFRRDCPTNPGEAFTTELEAPAPARSKPKIGSSVQPAQKADAKRSVWRRSSSHTCKARTH
ncbi:unnamed protein product [Cuscuta campestris]|uniref:CCHC-type domain-containing protein n=1 Tax=Cuscuta campestris TaxID=132261 RepID=A0A484MFU4_9ASTE|nr:unnamed protein product [Cuscuta campestris]